MPDPTTVDERFWLTNPGVFQKLLVVGVIKSRKFYQLVREMLCPLTEDGRDRRPDFTSSELNRIYRMAADHWDGMQNLLEPGQDDSIPLARLEELFRSEMDNGRISQKDAQAIFDAVQMDLEAYDFAPSVLERMASSPVLHNWLKQRMASSVVEVAYRQRMLRPISLEELQHHITKAIGSLGTTRSNVTRADVMFSRIRRNMPFACDLEGVNAAIGGGFSPGTTTLVAGINAGGKTILTMQWAKYFALAGANVVVFTTEQPPEDLIVRILCNHLEIGKENFAVPVSSTAILSDADWRRNTTEIPVLPEKVYADHEEKVQNFYYAVWPRLYFVDWSGTSKSILQDFETEMHQLTDRGFDPDVVIFDWIGGNMASQMMSKGHKLDIRLTYKISIDTLIDHGKRHRRIMFATAQLNKTNVGPTKKAVLMQDLAECKSMTDNVTNFVGISALRNKDSTNENAKVTQLLQSRQYLNLDKARDGPGGLVPVEAKFRIQAFKNAQSNRMHSH